MYSSLHVNKISNEELLVVLILCMHMQHEVKGTREKR